MSENNPFAENWQDCLRAHYTHVVREHDDNNEKSLITVLIDSGFTEDTIRALREEVVGAASIEEYQDEQETFETAEAEIGEVIEDAAPETIAADAVVADNMAAGATPLLADDVLIETVDAAATEPPAESPQPVDEPPAKSKVKSKAKEEPPEEPSNFTQMSLF